MKNILVLCTGNSCRSIIAEALLNHLGEGRIRAYSAGSFPTGAINPHALAVLENHSVSNQGYSSKSWSEYSNISFDLVITVCDNAANETCPSYLDDATRVHWGLPDPALVTSSEQSIKAAFEDTYTALKSRIEHLLTVPLDTLSNQQIKTELDKVNQNNG